MTLRRHAASPLALALVLTLSACGGPFGDRPPVEDSVMVDVLASLHVASADSSSITIAERDSLLRQHGLAPIEYLQAVHYYADRPERFSTLYGRVVDELSHRRARAEHTPPADREAAPEGEAAAD